MKNRLTILTQIIAKAERVTGVRGHQVAQLQGIQVTMTLSSTLPRKLEGKLCIFISCSSEDAKKTTETEPEVNLFFNSICVCISALADYLKWLIVHQEKEKKNQTLPTFQSNGAIYVINKIETSNLF